ncbi:3',5'-cyclic AMP phosphodiesterase CpdA [Algoriphagus ratkowskyi]|uniref:3',5'-cyclic AMP phosphodiesterase CpdA n=1 Tax=Algoriphagus ratkowskyi TaxID=57028 RepID=A0A2W7TD24_9BACT|nr:metallophosphoesterase [Algoriphagus ratkowskyi]PZX61192.1 3',5'-cyclic AMP phosphodiesterase CpdA [Algoriphagus ratkowskyi]TXD79313.1 Tat (twin-arginine translocation) pathway signal sequence containing protein [Algoriphagus ratkowskyi]
MKRRPFLKNLTLLGSGLVALPIAGFPLTVSRSQYLEDFQPVFKFVTASDGHFGQPDTDYKTSHQNLIEAIKRESDVDLVVFNGDLIHDDPSLMPEVKKVYDQLSPLPYYVAKGNHDMVSDSRWLEIWGQTSNTFFTVKNNYGMIILNSSNEAGDYLCIDLSFLRTALAELQALEQVFIFIHISQKDWTRHGIDCQEVLDLIGSYPNVKATFHGHDHDVDGVMWQQKKPYFWSGHFGGSWGNPFPSYRICEVDEKGKTRTALKRISDGLMLNSHQI